MLERAEGYVEEIPYTYGYQPEIAPANMAFALAIAGIEAPAVRIACELGFGQGVSLAVNAVAGDAHWFGNDLLPEHVAHARGLVTDTSAKITLTNETFAEFGARADLPSFDYVALHGVWSWVSASNRAIIVRFLRERLVPGGVVYIGWNTLAGWRSMLPLRERMLEEIRRLRSTGHSLESAIASARATVIAERDPETEVALKFLRRQSIPYLAHELFNRDWQPMEFGALACDLAAAGLEFAAEARPVDAFARLNFTAPQRSMLEGLDVIAREETKDRLLARKFRRDYFRKADGAPPATARPEFHDLMLVRRSIVCDDIVAGASAVRIDPELVRHVVNSLRPGPARIASLITARFGRESVLECVAALIRAECAVPIAADDSREVSNRRAADCRTLNARLLELSHRHPEASVLASPLTQAGVEGDRATLDSPETLNILGLIDENSS
ncbi:MAG: hypothetical protein RL469_1378 [Pseudomonadota bacterium]|jgi:hypothetical protein|nr:hypothetical protein [Gammaproteobacteria bacterium]